MSGPWIEFDACTAEIVKFGPPEVMLIARFFQQFDTDEADKQMWRALELAGFEIVETGQAEATAAQKVAREDVRKAIDLLKDLALQNGLVLEGVYATMGEHQLTLGYLREQARSIG